MGTLEAEVATPAPPWMVLGAAPLYEFGASTLRSAGYLVGAKLILGLDLSRANWLSVLIATPLILTAFTGLGLAAAGTTMFARRLNPVATILGSLSFFLSGVMYPVSVLAGLVAWARRSAAADARPERASRRAPRWGHSGSDRRLLVGAVGLFGGARPAWRGRIRVRASPRSSRRFLVALLTSPVADGWAPQKHRGRAGSLVSRSPDPRGDGL